MEGQRNEKDQRRTEEERLVRDHLPLVNYLVNEVAQRIPAHVSRDDLASAGMAGLAQAARSFEPERGIRFEHYASQRVRGALLDELRQRDWASRSVRARARRVQEATEELTGRLGRTPTTSEVADRLGCDRERVDSVMDDVQRAVVLNYESFPGEGEEALHPVSTETPDAVLLERERKAYLVDAVAVLPERLRKVIVGYFLEERSMQDLAAELGVTDSRISQMRSEALMLLRDGITTHLDPELMPPPAPTGRVGRRKAAYYAAIAERSDAMGRLSAPATLAALA